MNFVGWLVGYVYLLSHLVNGTSRIFGLKMALNVKPFGFLSIVLNQESTAATLNLKSKKNDRKT